MNHTIFLVFCSVLELVFFAYSILRRKIHIISGVIVIFMLSSCLYSDDQKISGGFVFNSQRSDIIGKFDIPPSVKKIECKGNFIFVEQNPLYPIPAIYDIDYYDYTSNDSILFWIIDTKKQTPIGPVDSAFFNKFKDSIFNLCH